MDNLSKRLLQGSCALVLTAAVATSAQAQSARKNLQTANKLYNQENYRSSIPYYEKVLASDPNNAQALFRAGVAYLSFDKEKASDYIYKAQKLKPKVSKDVEYWLGRVDHLNYNFDEAITHYNSYSAKLKKNDVRKEEVAQLIKHSMNAKVLFNQPKDIFVENLGPSVNTQYAEHSPVISSDDKMLIYTTRANPADIPGLANGPRDKSKQAADGEYYEGIVEARRIDAKTWEKPRSLSAALNSKGHDSSIQLYDNDTKLLMYRSDNDGDILTADKSGSNWGAPKELGSNINSKSFESDAYMTPDGKTLYFSTNRYTEDGTLDLYYSTRASMTDSWGPAKSLGSTINTKYDEDSPYMSADGKTLYFSSRGHNTMGGYDIFMSTYDEGSRKWGAPENMGYPINTPDDDTYYRLAPDGTYAYLSSYRIGGYGEKDIYTINYIKNLIVQGKVLSKRDSTTTLGPGVELIFNGKKADGSPISFRDVTKDDGSYSVSLLSGRTYTLVVNKDGKNIETQEFTAPISKDDKMTITKNIYADFIGGDIVDAGLKPIYFDTDKFKLRPDALKVLAKNTAILKANPGLNISVEGNCDSRNTDEYNMVLGQNRADAGKNYLVKQGIAAGRLTTVSYGERKPVAPNDSPENMQLNRRDDFKPVLREGERMPVIVESTTVEESSMTMPATAPMATPQAGKTKTRLSDGTKVKTKIDPADDKVKIKTKGTAGEKSKTIGKDGEIDAKAKDASGEKAKVKAKL